MALRDQIQSLAKMQIDFDNITGDIKTASDSKEHLVKGRDELQKELADKQTALDVCEKELLRKTQRRDQLTMDMVDLIKQMHAGISTKPEEHVGTDKGQYWDELARIEAGFPKR